MLRSLTILLAFQLAGEALAAALGLPLPGPVLGMLLLFVALLLRGRPSQEFRQHSHTLLRYLPLVLIPPSVGIMDHWGTAGAAWLPIALVIVVSTLLSLLISGWLLQRLSARS